MDAFVGRQAELSRLIDEIDSGTRLTTIVGPAGVGKTRLALAAASQLSTGSTFEGGVHYAELGALRSAAELLATVTAALPWRGRSQRTDVEALAERCALRGPFLLVLNDAERLVEAVSVFVNSLYQLAPDAHFLVASREPLGLRGEAVFSLDGLPSERALELFRLRAKTGRTKSEELGETEAIAQLVTKLEGNPLAIELAAARAEVLSPGALLDRLDDRLTLLALPGRSPLRHASLRAAIALSWELLDVPERVALARLAVFAAPFKLAAAEALLEDSALEAVHTLVRKSLVRADRDHFVVFESVRAFALEQLALLGDAGLVRRLKTGHYLRTVRSWSLPPSETTRRELLCALPDWLDALEASSAADPAVAAELGIGMDAVLYGRVPFEFHRTLAERTLAAAEQSAEPLLVAQACVAEARALRVAGDNPGAYTSLRRARAIAPADHPIMAELLRLMGQVERHRGNLEEARRLLLAALAVAETSVEAARGPLLDDLGVVSLDTGDLGRAEQHTLDALAHHRRSGDRRYEGISLGHLGLVAHLRGATDDAARRYGEALTIARETGDARFEDFTRAFLAMLALEQGDLERARTLLDNLAGDEQEPLGGTDEPADPRAHALLACAEAVLAACSGRTSEAAEVLAQARTRLGAECDSERGALAMVLRALPHHTSTTSHEPPSCAEQRLVLRLVTAMPSLARMAPPRALKVGPEGRWFSLEGRTRVSLARRRSLQLLLAFLVRMREQSPGVGASWQELLGAGWPGEQVLPAAGQRRAYVAISTLRSLGLAEVLLHTDDGYLLDPDVPLVGQSANL